MEIAAVVLILTVLFYVVTRKQRKLNITRGPGLPNPPPRDEPNP